jgi:hypothetical protein
MKDNFVSKSLFKINFLFSKKKKEKDYFLRATKHFLTNRATKHDFP